jgi:phage terminase large subunit GpA-like protein
MLRRAAARSSKAGSARRSCNRPRLTVSAGSRPRLARGASAPIISTRCRRRSCRGTRSRRACVAAETISDKQKTLDNLTFGVAHEQRGDAPDVARLMERREDYPQGIVPADGLIFVCGADVQHNGIWYEAVAYGDDKQSWSIEHRFLEGDTTDPTRGAFLQLAEVYDRGFPDAFGGTRLIEALAVDAGDGGRSNQVYAWCAKRHRAFAIKGQPGWTTPAIGTPTPVSITLKGKKIKGKAMVWPVGTYSLKGTYYDNLRKDGARAGKEIDPPGYCHHHQGCDENFFRQQTAESVKTVKSAGPLAADLGGKRAEPSA